MKINRHNYEEYFILYMDNELNAEERRQVENFIALHPDLKEELDMLLHTQIAPDNRIVFESKNDLMKFDVASTSINAINLSNYDEWLTLYVDNELNDEQKKAVEKFASENAAAKKQLELFLKSKLQPELISFPNKEALYRREEKVRRIPVWIRISAAAAILLAVGTTSLLIINNNKKETEGIARVNTGTSQGTSEKTKSNITTPAENVIDNNTEQQIASTTNESAAVLAREDKNTSAKVKPIEVPVSPVQKDETQASEVLAKINNGNNLPSPEKNPNVTPVNPSDNAIAGNIDIKKTDNKPLTPSPEISAVTNPSDETYNNGVTVSQPGGDETEEEQPSGKKNKLRGFFRKVTRTFEKRTSIDPTDGDDRLLVGGLAIKLK